ncbi:hypothetical protein LTR09_001485 [Extremus antarcticus]|uniref:Uncharacterized protein n=1 Tax=Extremus antarcticus TaxID=702011 RepID=A0AAJ0LW14_9PEZI|nr:hypothetical protein LTR09_001485 [Extremus antarcticus]
MAAIFIVAGLAIADKVEKRKEAKRLKKERDEVRYRELQVETNRRLATKQRGDGGGDVIDNIPAYEEDAETSGEEQMRSAVDEASPPPYDDVVAVGEMRERNWKTQMQRRRSSVTSQRSGAQGQVASPT